MDQAFSHPAPLRLFLDNIRNFFKDFKDYGHRNGLNNLKSGHLRNLYELEWLVFNTNWLPEGTFNLSLIGKTKDIIYKRPGHPNQIPYTSM